MDSTMTAQERKTIRRPLCYMAAAVLAMALPSAGLTLRNKSSASVDSLSGTSSRNLMRPSPRGGESATVQMMLTDERQEFEINLGKAVDTLKHDYPDILTEPPDFSVYHPKLEVVDPAGVTLHGLPAYRNAFRLVHTVVNLFYCPERSLLTFRLVYDWARNEIRVSWNAEVVPKQIFGGTKTTLHVDGISAYVFDKQSGKIVQHRVEHLMINDVPIKPERGIIHALRKEVIEPDGIPVCFKDDLFSLENRFFGKGLFSEKSFFSEPANMFQPQNSFSRHFSEQQIVKFQPHSPSSLFSRQTTSLFSVSNDLDSEAFERKNASRKKFGLKPLTPEEFKEIQAQVEQMDIAQRASAQASTTTTPVQSQKKEKGFLGKLFGEVLQDTCEDNFDCKRPEVCCDFGFVKKCCTSGMLVGDHPHLREPATVPVVAGYPPRGGPMGDTRNF